MTMRGATFVAASIHKWLLGPYGACLCYCAPSFWQTALPIEQHDRNREGAQNVECLPMHPTHGYPTEFLPGARRLDSGGRWRSGLKRADAPLAIEDGADLQWQQRPVGSAGRTWTCPGALVGWQSSDAFTMRSA